MLWPVDLQREKSTKAKNGERLRTAQSARPLPEKYQGSIETLYLNDPTTLSGSQTLLPQSGMGPSYMLVLIGAAAAQQVQTAATTRTKVLTARFIELLLACGSPGSGNPRCEELYSQCQVENTDNPVGRLNDKVQILREQGGMAEGRAF